MSSTERQLDIDALFDDVLMPLARQRRGEPPFPLGPDPALDTYFVRREKPAMTRDDFIAPSCIGFDEFEQRLAAYWTAAGKPDLASSAARFAQAARAVYAPATEDAEVSPFIYVMF